MKDSQPTKILRLGALQVGKTTGAVKESLEESKKTKNLISVFIAHKTNVNKDNQEIHIQGHYQGKIELLETDKEISAFTTCLEKDINMFSSEYPICISCLDHYSQLEAVLTLSALKTKFVFDVYIDESDSMALYHEVKKSEARKDNIVDSLIRQSSIRRFICLTATPFTEIASSLHWDEIVNVKPGPNYKGLHNSTIEKVTESAMKEFNRGVISYSIEEIIKEQAALSNTVTLISTKKGNTLHYKQAKALSALLDQDCLVAVLNSSPDQKYFVQGKTHYIPTKRNGVGQLNELFEVAKNFSKLFIIGYDMLSRSVTFKRDKFQEISGLLFSASEDTTLSFMLQRLGRVCGYQDRAGTIFTDKEKLVRMGLLQYPEMLKVASEYKDPQERMKALLHKVPIFFTNIFGLKNNGKKIKSSSRVASMKGVADTEAEELGFYILSEYKEIQSNELPKEVLEQLKADKKAVQGSALYNYILDQNHKSNRILNPTDTSVNMALPNAAIEDNYRDTLWKWINGILKIVVQPQQTIRDNVPFAVHNIFTGGVDCYSPTGKFRV
jgi:hypothetical protein